MVRSKFLFVVVLMSIGTSSLFAKQQSNCPQEKFVKKIGEEILTIIDDEGLAVEQKEARFRNILRQNFDLDYITKFVLGRAGKEATDAEKTEFRELFEDYIVQVFADKFKEFTGSKLKITGAKNGDNGKVTVLSEITRTSKPLKVDWDVYGEDGEFLARNVTVEGLQLINSQREVIASTIAKNGGTVSGANGALRKNLAKNGNGNN